MKLTDEEIVNNWNELLNLIRTELSGIKRDNMLKLHEHFENRMCFTPASGKEHFHNAFPGGYVKHVLNVVKCSKELEVVWKNAGTNVNFSDEELVFSAICHDLGKVGSLYADYYIPNESEWHRKNQGMVYKYNSEINYMSVSDRTFYLLSYFQVPYTENEFLAIRLADGLYAESNKSYLIGYDDGYSLKTNLPFIIHSADFLAMHSEYDAWKNLRNSSSITPKIESSASKKSSKSAAVQKGIITDKNIDLSDFDKLFSKE